MTIILHAQMLRSETTSDRAKNGFMVSNQFYNTQFGRLFRNKIEFDRMCPIDHCGDVPIPPNRVSSFCGDRMVSSLCFPRFQIFDFLANAAALAELISSITLNCIGANRTKALQKDGWRNSVLNPSELFSMNNLVLTAPEREPA
jgi:hypothetical protein